MAIVSHQFNCTIPDDPTAAGAGMVLPSHWNGTHAITADVYGGNNITVSISGGSTTVHGASQSIQTQGTFDSNQLTNYVPTTNSSLFFLDSNSTTLAPAVHTHSQYLTTAAESNHLHTQYLTTAALSDHTHSDLYIPLANSTAYQTATLANTFFPSSQTTQFAGTGTTFTGTNVSGSMTLNSNGLNLALSAGAGGAGNTLTVSGSNGTLQTNGLTVLGSNIVSAYTTTGNQFVIAAPNQTDLTNHAHPYSNATTAVSSRVVQIAAGTGTLSGNLTITGSNGISVANVGNEIRVSLIDSHHVDAMAFAGNNAGTAFSQMTSGTVTLAFAGAVSGSQAGNAITISAPAQTVQTQGMVSVNGSTGNISITAASNSSGGSMSVNGSSITFGVATNYSTNWTNITSNAFNTSGSSNFVLTANSSLFQLTANNSLSAGTGTSATNASITLNSNGLAISVAAPGGGGGAAIQGSGTYSQNTGTVQFANSNGVTFGLSNNGVMTASIAAAPAAGIGGIAAGGSTFTSGTVEFGNRAGVSFITSNGSVCVSEEAHVYATGWSLVGNTAGTNSSGFTTESPLYLSGGPNITLSGSSNSIVISAGAAGGAVTVGGWEVFPAGNNTTASSLGQRSLYMQKVNPAQNYSFNNIELRMSNSMVTTTNNSAAVSYTLLYGLYSLDGADSYNSIGTSSIAIYGSANSSSSMGITISQGAGSFTSGASTATIAPMLSGYKHLYLPFASTLTAGGNYAVGIIASSTTTGGTGALRLAFVNETVINNLTVGKIYATTAISSNSTYVGDYNQGVYSATTSALPSAVAKSEMTNAVSQARLYLQFEV